MSQRISIAIGTFNGEKFFEKQLKSLAEQTVKPDEVIICDDCSNDSTYSIAECFSRTVDYQVKVYKNDHNEGYVRNFSRALQYCSGDYVFLCDQDDVWNPRKIERIVGEFLKDKNIQLIIHDVDYCTEGLVPIGQTKIERMRPVFDLERSYVVGMATAIRGSFLKICLPIPSESLFAHDFWLHRCAEAVGGKKIIHEVLAKYRRHKNNATQSENLNVDFITTPSHFFRENFRKRSTCKSEQIALFLRWLIENDKALVKGKYCGADRLKEVIQHEKKYLENAIEREKIFNMTRAERIFPVLNLLRNGGYKDFSGIKSAIKDLFLN